MRAFGRMAPMAASNFAPLAQMNAAPAPTIAPQRRGLFGRMRQFLTSDRLGTIGATLQQLDGGTELTDYQATQAAQMQARQEQEMQDLLMQRQQQGWKDQDAAIGTLDPSLQPWARLAPEAAARAQFESPPETYGDLEAIDGRLGQRNRRTGQYDWAPQVPAGSIYQPPAGYRGTAETGLEPIPGGPADVRATAEGRSRMQQMDSSARQLENAISVLDDTLGDVNGGTAGLLANRTREWGFNQGSTDLNEALEPVRAILSFENLAEMRRNSATGGALGSIAVRELELLGNTVRSLSVSQSPERLRANIEATRAALQRTLTAIQAARQEMNQGPDEAPAEPYVDAPTSDGSAAPQPRRRVWTPERGLQ